MRRSRPLRDPAYQFRDESFWADHEDDLVNLTMDEFLSLSDAEVSCAFNYLNAHADVQRSMDGNVSYAIPRAIADLREREIAAKADLNASLVPVLGRLSAMIQNPHTSESEKQKAVEDIDFYTKQLTNNELTVVASLARPLFTACDQPSGNAASSSYADNQRTWLLDAEPSLWDRADFSVDLCKENFGGIFMSVGTMLSGRSFRAEARKATCMAQFVAKSVSALEHSIFQELCSADNVCVELEQPTIINSRPDMVWYANGTPVLVHEHKASRSFPLRPTSVPANAVRGDLLSYYYETYGEAVRKPVAQTYGYMVVMGLKYGVLSTTEFTWFLRRPDGPESTALEITDAFSCADSGEHSVNMAYTQMLLMAMNDDDSVGYFPRDLDSGLGHLVLNKWADFLDSQHARATPVYH
ncbi:Hypothetical Protein FCC1311_113772 [Hondaea fermentalgiana]|uniref:Uncharacterized protein n=1 Tax=Hondaea fermentalgiana TaxID=2315210 RepID=A0A2R5H3Y6_9STRA|nr:Hypothetical Protein FCC1311_113772 [Hondaea fermentalgiana]|eukprot:GBG35154.1 Hypothetical Protein FCC1311_113772 [Hondaea fermentalgiana]